MAKRYLFIFFITFLSGCSSTSLEEAIEKNRYDNVQILFEDTNDQVVIFYGEDTLGTSTLGLNVYSTGITGYRYESGTGETSRKINKESTLDMVNVERINHNSMTVLWGWLYNYPNAREFDYTIFGKDGNEIYTSTIKVNENGVVYEKLPIDLGDILKYHYKIYDNEGNIIGEK